MKKRLFLASCAVTMMAGAMILSSCGSKGEEYSYNPGQIHENDVKDYQSAFVQKYGEISPYETWDLSQRGSQLAGFAGTRASNKAPVQNMSATQSYGYLLDAGNHESTIANLFNHNWDRIIQAFADQNETENWTTYTAGKKIVFSVAGVTRSSNSSTKYFYWGLKDTPQGDLFVRIGSANNGNDASIGNSCEQHTSSLDFSKAPNGSVWYTAYTNVNNNKFALTSSNTYVIDDFKIVTVNINGTDYTFWGLKCDVTDPDYTNMILWVKEVPSVPVPKISKRYMAEDLGGNNDFDFNDVVFDVIQYEDGTEKCLVRALGGTLDITINVGNSHWTKSSKYTITDMLNTDPIDTNRILAEFDVTGWNGNNNTVSITVKGKEGVTEGGTTEEFYWAEPFPAVGEAPLIVAVQYGSKTWMRERQGVPNKEWFGFTDVDLAE
jgi:hypothetical protein